MLNGKALPPDWYVDAFLVPELIDAAQRVSRSVCNRLEQKHKRQSGSAAEHAPLYLIFGENHYVFDHMALKVLVLDALHKRGVRVACGIEMPHNYIEMSGHVVSQPVRRRADGLIHDDTYALHALGLFCFDYHLITGARREQKFDHPHSMLFSYLWRRMAEGSLSARFIDATCVANHEAREAGADGGLDLVSTQPPLESKILQNLGVSIDLPHMSRTSSMALRMRDAYMCEAIAQHLCDLGANDRPDVYFISCGASHVFGGASYACATGQAHSKLGLAAYFRERADIFPVLAREAYEPWQDAVEQTGVMAKNIPASERLMIAAGSMYDDDFGARCALGDAGLYVDALYKGRPLYEVMQASYEAYAAPAALSPKP